MKIVTAQLNYTIGDFQGNTEKILDVIKNKGNDADLIVFSELCVTGYYPKDLLQRKGFIEKQNRAVAKIREATKNIHAAVVIGTVQENPFNGKAFLNALEFIENGETRFNYHKQLLPTYGVFDEARHFEPGNLPATFLWKGRRLGFLICEDAWEDGERPLYKRDPVKLLEKSQLDLIVSINASPYSIYKRTTRHGLVKTIATRCNAPVVYVNQVGAIDELVFDGNSLVYSEKAECLFDGVLFKEEVAEVNLAQEQPVVIEALNDMEIITNQLVTGLKDYCDKSGFEKVVIGSSGGIDSAVTIAIAALAMGSQNVIAVTMPSKYSSAGSVDDSVALCDALEVELINAPIKATFDTEVQAYTEAFGSPPSGLAQENLQARIRGQRLMTYSNTTGAMVVSTGNKTEMSVGYCTLYGDMAGGVSLLADLYKLQVYALAKYLNNEVFKKEVIPQIIIDKEPSAELAPDQKDSDALPPYDQLDAFLHLLLEHDLLEPEEIEKHSKTASMMREEDKAKVKRLLDRNEYKRRQAAPVIRINRRSFGADRQIPLTAKVTEVQ
ncbi:NAD+ synthase [Teredinibacter sp. KSP-S5-2]|uniref:NAD+ synthase n=1 Tax=Teredinibacter sp. KSP-S5-2 TaxID=3034506 RepID=UPI0029351886|nr:NAD+ synthase [Teredinibacter sp. KSP-S5-2]WNO10863.1 NAD+ synthase [Teredinibacter sp. KSP-S5-2]